MNIQLYQLYWRFTNVHQGWLSLPFWCGSAARHLPGLANPSSPVCATSGRTGSLWFLESSMGLGFSMKDHPAMGNPHDTGPQNMESVNEAIIICKWVRRFCKWLQWSLKELSWWQYRFLDSSRAGATCVVKLQASLCTNLQWIRLLLYQVGLACIPFFNRGYLSQNITTLLPPYVQHIKSTLAFLMW